MTEYENHYPHDYDSSGHGNGGGRAARCDTPTRPTTQTAASRSAAGRDDFDWPALADAIRVHENSVHFPYGAERRINGRPVGFPEPAARRICLRICTETYAQWVAGGRKGDYFVALNGHYAADTNWCRDVKRIYWQTRQ